MKYRTIEAIQNEQKNTRAELNEARAEHEHAEHITTIAWHRVLYYEHEAFYHDEHDTRFNNAMARAYDIYDNARNAEREHAERVEKLQIILEHLNALIELYYNE